MDKLSHLNSSGEARMVDISPKGDTEREAVARGRVMMNPATLELIKTSGLQKGDVLAVSRVAGIMAAKKTPDLIPLCHPLMLSNITIEFDLSGEDAIGITARVKNTGKTGVEMEALVATSVAALTIYDMAKSVDRGMTITDICLESKRGGKSGIYRRETRD
ncbi:MAG: cyclic pyranopterin monophosphate synthase MoaC [Dehalococcoidales bacterium]|nr:cyclic pyranopterin monophosphate synthase MoaC [Dehalococcoidales bacterium]